MKNGYAITSALLATTILGLPVYGNASERHRENVGMDAATGQHLERQGQLNSGGHGMAEMFLIKKEIDGYSVSFHVMDAKQDMAHGGSHDFMLKIEQGGQPLKGLLVNSKVIFPDGKSGTKPLIPMGDWYMAGYDLGHAGRHQLMVLFKTPDGRKHKGGVYYEGLSAQ